MAIPMRVPFRGITHREAVLVEGPAGWGEFAPFLEYDDVESARWWQAALEAATFGFPTPVRRSVAINATVPAVPAAEVGAVLDRFPGCTTAKVKVAQAGQSLQDDLDRVAAVRERIPTVRVDANGAWTVDEAIKALKALGELEYCEQPCATVEELAAVRRQVGTRIAADESIRKASDPLRVRDLEAADIIVLKVAPLGGVRSALRVAEECGLPCVVSSALDTSVGIAMGAALAGALPELAGACGLGTVSLLGGDVVRHSLDGSGGSVAVRPAVPSTELLERWKATEDRQRWWSERVVRCIEVLGSQA